MIEIKPTTYQDSIKKKDFIKKVAEVTDLKQSVVKDVLNAFTDLYLIELLTTGAVSYPGLPVVTRKKKGQTKRYQRDLDKTLIYPETFELRARVPENAKKLHREMIRAMNNEKNGVSAEDWWKPYFYCDGDWRKQEKTE